MIEHLKITAKQARSLMLLLSKLEGGKWDSLNFNKDESGRLIISPSIMSEAFFQYTIDTEGRTVKV